jgi:fibro-slime domain-containing protein
MRVAARLSMWALGWLMATAAACGSSEKEDPFAGSGGDGSGSGVLGGTAAGGSPGSVGGSMVDSDQQQEEDAKNCGNLNATVRDFKDSHPDFEKFGGDDVQAGIVKSELGADHKPVYAASGSTPDTSGPDAFKQWYNDVSDVNEAFPITIPLSQTQPGLFVYDNANFYPVDGMGFGNEGRQHNYHFTTEIHTRFKYNGGEVFTFRGDDDLWAFVNGKLAIDLGGLHTPKTQTINFDQRAAELGLTKGENYAMDIFHAERKTVMSNFRIETSIACFQPVTLL